jgi:hypothetical protein
VFEQGSTQAQTAFKFALSQKNEPVGDKAPEVEFQAFVNIINTNDAFKLSRISK